ncbi:hypothetical protein M422DRAFT_243280 [Sphaerobolus stellatus SS14]|nr:hypothetical protein M422DRAFT_243280 [Sphaerobolus stellatus SS14]
MGDFEIFSIDVPPRIATALYLAGAGREMVTTPISPAVSPICGLSPIEIVRDSVDTGYARDKLAASAADNLLTQVNSRFILAVLLTQSNCTVFMFDRSGAVVENLLIFMKNRIFFVWWFVH